MFSTVGIIIGISKSIMVRKCFSNFYCSFSTKLFLKSHVKKKNLMCYDHIALPLCTCSIFLHAQVLILTGIFHFSFSGKRKKKFRENVFEALLLFMNGECLSNIPPAPTFKILLNFCLISKPFFPFLPSPLYPFSSFFSTLSAFF